MAYFVELSSRAVELISKNLESLKLDSGFKILKQDSVRALRELEAGGVQADFVFLDPPYRKEEACRRTLEAVSKSRLLKAESIVMAEHSKKFDPGGAFGPLRRYRKLTQGDTALSFYRGA
jgi:16S rRNA G966 N2-methylase RsmD